MRKSALRALLVVVGGLIVGVLANPSRVHAQGGVLGSIVGNVFDQTGMPMPGVKIVAKSPTQIGGERTTYSGQDGSFRIAALQPGIFELTASAPKMNGINQKGLKVGINAPAEANIIMEVATAQETVKVIEKAPIVSTKSANVKEVWDEEFIDNLPLETRTSVEELVTAAPGGSGDPNGRVARVRGGNQNQTVYLVDGFNLTGLKTTYKSLAAAEISTAGYGADGAIAPGGLVSMVTKTGSNRWEFDVSGFHEDSRMKFFQDESDKVPLDLRSYITPNVSGPIIKDKLWFYVNTEARNEIYSSYPDPNSGRELPNQHYWNYRGTVKLSYQVNPRNKLQTFTFIDKNYSRNRNRSYNAETAAQQMRDRYGFFSGLTWESLLLDNVFFKVQAGLSQQQEDTRPQDCTTDGVDCLHRSPILQTNPSTGVITTLNNNPTLLMLDIQGIELVGTLEGFFEGGKFGSHNVKLQSRFFSRNESTKASIPGDLTAERTGEVYTAINQVFANDPRADGVERFGYPILATTGSRFTTTLQDTAKVTRYFTVTPGVAVTMSSSSNNRTGESVTEGAAVTPHFSAAWDATHDGRTVVRGSFNQYVDADVGRLAKHNLGGGVSRRCTSPGATSVNEILDGAATGAGGVACTYSGGASSATVGSPCGPSGYDAQGNLCLTKLKTPRTWEYTIGMEREIADGVGLGLDFVYRDFKNQFSTKETNRIWNAGGSGFNQGGGFRNGRAQTVIDLETPDEAKRTYQGATLALHKRDGALNVSGSYTWARQRGNIWDTEVNAWGDIPPRDLFLDGPTPDDVRHNIRGTLVYRFFPWLSAGVLYQYNSGVPYSRYYRNDVTGGYDDLRARVGINPGADINNPDDDRATRAPDIQRFNLQVRSNLKPILRHDVELYADILNALALRTPTSIVQQDGPTYGTPSGFMDPLKVRLGFRYRY
jgi:hypothetical protein